MATLVAQEAIVFDANGIFGIFTRSSAAEYNSAFTNRTGNGFTFTGEGDVRADVAGVNFIHIAGIDGAGRFFAYPAQGTFQSIEAFHGFDIWFTITDFSANFAAGAPIGRIIADHGPSLFAQMVAGADNLTGSPYADVLFGFGGNDLINGGAGDDSLAGGPGEDILDGQAGNDRLNGELDADHFRFTTALSSTINVDTVVGFVRGEDIIELDNAVFAKLKTDGALKKKFFEIGKKASDKNDFIVFNRKTDTVSYDKNGNKKGGAVNFAKLEGASDDISHTDFFVV